MIAKGQYNFVKSKRSCTLANVRFWHFIEPALLWPQVPNSQSIPTCYLTIGGSNPPLGVISRCVKAVLAKGRKPNLCLQGVDNLIGNDGEAAVVEFRYFLAESRQLVAKMTRITDRIVSDPSRFLFGEREAEFKAK